MDALREHWPGAHLAEPTAAAIDSQPVKHPCFESRVFLNNFSGFVAISDVLISRSSPDYFHESLSLGSVPVSGSNAGIRMMPH